jgi:formate dehydrogenase subunit beta
MNVNRILHIRDGNTLGTVQDFLATWWLRVGLDAMLAPIQLPGEAEVSPQWITDPAELDMVNPFAPIMLDNSATMIEGFVREHPNHHLAVLLRPCELRALVELQKRHRVHYRPASDATSYESLVVIGVDCPGTFFPEEYTRHVHDQREDAEMLHVQMSYGKQASYVPFDVRQTCQLCDSPGPMGADITIGTIGIEPQGELLIIAKDEGLDRSLQLQDMTDGMATERQVVCREMMIGKMVDQRTENRNALLQGHTFGMEELSSTLAMFARCTLCADCLDACPLYDGELAGMLGAGDKHHGPQSLLSELVKVSRWLASCSGCGMCRESCAHGVPLGQFINVLSHRIQAQLHYKPGDPSQPLPWSVDADKPFEYAWHK